MLALFNAFKQFQMQNVLEPRVDPDKQLPTLIKSKRLEFEFIRVHFAKISPNRIASGRRAEI